MTWPAGWHGYLPPTSNTTYTPNQFFDVVLPHSSRGVVRLVAYLIRKTLGWCDAQGRPQETEIALSYRDIARDAGIAQSMLREALQEAAEARYVECVHAGHPDRAGSPAETARYQLKWDARAEYVSDPADFQGFFAGNGNLTYIPNQFFDETIPNEPLSVVRVVGAVIRHTIGWQTQYGFRRQEVALSFTDLERQTRLSRPSVWKALHLALAHQHLCCRADGLFTPDPAAQKAAVYGLHWADPAVPASPKKEALRKVNQDPRGHRFEKLTSTASKKQPAKRFEKLTSIREITPLRNKTLKQQQRPPCLEPALPAAPDSAADLINSLLSHGLNRTQAVQAAAERPAQCRLILDYVPYKVAELGGEEHFKSSKAAWMYRAIYEDNFGPPRTYVLARQQQAAREQAAQARAEHASQKACEEARRSDFHAYLLQRLETLERDTPSVIADFLHEEQRACTALTQAKSSVMQRAGREFHCPELRLTRWRDYLARRSQDGDRVAGVLTFGEWNTPPDSHAREGGDLHFRSTGVQPRADFTREEHS